MKGIAKMTEDGKIILGSGEVIEQDSPRFFEILSWMKGAQVSKYVGNCADLYTDVIQNREYDLGDASQRFDESYFRVLKLNDQQRVIMQTVYYKEPTSVISLP